MKVCRNCDQKFNDQEATCPFCGSEIYNTLIPADILRRFAAVIIDGIVLLGPAIFIVLNFYTHKNVPLLVIFSLPYFIYRPLMHYFFKATVGKMLLKIEVVTLKGEHLLLSQAVVRFIIFFLYNFAELMTRIYLIQNIDLTELSTMNDLQAVLQNVPSHIAALSQFAMILFFINISVIIFNREKRGLHDLLARSYCVLKR